MTSSARGDPARRSYGEDGRPRSMLLLVSRLMGERFAGTPIGEQFARPMMRQGAV